VNQIAVRRMKLHAIKPGLLRAPGRGGEVLHQAFNVRRRERAGAGMEVGGLPRRWSIHRTAVALGTVWRPRGLTERRLGSPAGAPPPSQAEGRDFRVGIQPSLAGCMAGIVLI